MLKSTAGHRLTLRRVVIALATAAAVTSALASGANAAVFRPDPTDPNSLGNAITAANTNTDPSNTIVLADGAYLPTAGLPAISKTLTITGDHSLQEFPTSTSGGGPKVSGGNISDTTQNLFTVNSGTVTFEGIAVTGGGNNTGGGQAVMINGGTVNIWNDDFSGNGGSIQVVSGASLNVLNSTVDSLSPAIVNNGNATLEHVTLAFGFRGAIQNTGTMSLNDSILNRNNRASSTIKNCLGAPTSFANDYDSDGSCTGTTNTGISLALTSQKGGPTPSDSEGSTSTTIGAANPLTCPSTDQRFFVQATTPPTSCDEGSYQNGAAQQNTGPTCATFGANNGVVNNGGVLSQNVQIADTQSGLGPESGSPFDPAAADGSQPTTNPRSILTPAIDSDVVAGLYISNGTVAASYPTSPTQPTLMITATKTTPGTPTSWSFTAVNWAGVETFCR